MVHKDGHTKMIKRQSEVEDIIKGLSLLQYYVKFSSNKLGWHTINKVCESFFAELFNMLWDLKLKTLKRDHPGIDLADKANGYSVQITSGGTKQKVNHTIEQFEKEQLYRKYRTLLHFVVGEKHFAPSTKDRYKFEKGEHDSYWANAKIDGHHYQIIVQDIYDLILIINEIESDRLSQIYTYINNNINQFVEQVKQPFYNFEPEDVEEFSAESFMTHCDVDVKERDTLKNDLEKLADVLNGLPENTRRFLFYAMQARDSQANMSGLIVNHSLLRKRLDIDSDVFREEIDILRGSKLLDENNLQDKIFILEYIDSGGGDLLESLYDFCNEDSEALRDLIVHVNFKRLD